jgi:hypothetical protein
MLGFRPDFNDVYAGRSIINRRMRGLFLKIFRFMDFNEPELRDRLHSNTITIKPYPEKVSGDPGRKVKLTGRVASPAE